jgi:hypothetical protein
MSSPTSTTARPLPAQSTITDEQQLDAELDRLLGQQFGFSLAEVEQITGDKTTFVYGLINKKEVETYLDGSRRKITRPSLKNYLKRKVLEGRGQGLRRSPGRPRKIASE